MKRIVGRRVLAAASAAALVAGITLPADAFGTWSDWRNCYFFIGGGESEYTPVRWHIYDTGASRRIDIIQFGNGNSERINSMTAYEITSDRYGIKAGTGLQAYPNNVYTYTYYTTTTQMPLQNDSWPRKLYIHLRRAGNVNPECVYTHDF